MTKVAGDEKNILIVDDSPIILERLCKMINRIGEDWTPLLAATFRDALGYLQNFRVRVAIFDIHLQDESGIELLRRAIHLYPDLFVIMLSNQASREVNNICIGIGAKYFLDKSLDFPRIPQIISSLR